MLHQPRTTFAWLKANEKVGKDSVIMCAESYYAVLDSDENLYYVAFLEPELLERFRKWITQFRKSKYRVGSDL